MLDDILDRLGEREQRLVGGGILLLSLAALFTYVLQAPLKVYRSGLASRALLEQAALQGAEIGVQLEQLRAEVAGLERQLHGDTANLPDKQLEAFVVGRLQTISWRNGVELISVEPTSGEAVATFSESLFHVELSGNYFDLFDWFSDVNDELGFVVIKEYQMRPVENVADDPLLVVNLTIASYRTAEV